VLGAGTLTVCTQCAARRELTQDALLPGVRIAGSASFVAEALQDGVQALVY
jgi:predicted peroxiredoxin